MTALAPSPAARTWSVTEHKLRAMRSYVGTVIATAFGTPFLYLFAFGIGLATLITENEGFGGVAGVGYLQFVAPALICSAAVNVAAEEYMFGILLGFKWNPIFVGMNSTPITGRQIIDGIGLFVIIRAAITSTIYALVALLFGAISPGWALLVVPIAVLTALAFSPIAAYTATITEDKGQFNYVNRLIIMPLTLFSGTVFPLAQLPIFLQWIGWLSPLWHGSELGRQVSYGPTEPIWLTVIHLVFLAALAVVGWQWTVRITERRLDR